LVAGLSRPVLVFFLLLSLYHLPSFLACLSSVSVQLPFVLMLLICHWRWPTFWRKWNENSADEGAQRLLILVRSFFFLFAPIVLIFSSSFFFVVLGAMVQAGL
jgi:hypothetical protein